MGADDLKTASDDELVERFRTSGDAAHYAELFRRHVRSIYASCYSAVQNRGAAEDLTQETFVKALVKMGQYRSGNFGGWLATIARRECLSYLRSKPARDLVAGLAAEEEFAEFSTSPETAHAVRDVLAQLPANQRVCLKLLYMHGCTYKEAGELMRLPESDIKSHAQNGRRRFILLWGKGREGPPGGRL